MQHMSKIASSFLAMAAAISIAFAIAPAYAQGVQVCNASGSCNNTNPGTNPGGTKPQHVTFFGGSGLFEGGLLGSKIPGAYFPPNPISGFLGGPKVHH